MKTCLKKDKYGFYIYDLTREEHGMRHLNIHYAKEETKEDVIFTYKFASKGLFKTLTKYKEFEGKFRDYNIIQGIAFIINQSSYAWMRKFDNDDFEVDMLDSIPDSLVANKVAMQELLSNLNPSNKHLIVYVGEYIKERSKLIEEEKEAYIEANKEIFDKYDQLKEEFKF